MDLGLKSEVKSKELDGGKNSKFHQTIVIT